MQNIDISEILKNGAQYQGKHVTVAGWVRTARDSKTMAFLALNDGTSLKHLQIVIDKTKFDQDALATVMKNGASVVAQGTVVAAMKEGVFSKILIANRGEIALRIIRFKRNITRWSFCAPFRICVPEPTP